MKETSSCYKCDKKATTREHVPPICLFPEFKDAKVNLRKDLITVPSCEDHNSKKSDDDEFLMISLAACLGNNFTGFFHSNTKIQRALSRKKDFYHTKVLADCKEIIIKSEEGKSIRAYVGKPDYARLVKCFEHIALGIYHHEYAIAYRGECGMILTFTFSDEENEQSHNKVVRNKFAEETVDCQPKGANPEVFTYLFSPEIKDGFLSLKMTFYGNADVYVAFKIEDDAEPPYDLAFELIKMGINTTILLNGETIEFNKKKR